MNANDLIVEPEGTPGYEVVRRREGEPCVAVIHHPKGSRRWHVTYRCPVGGFADMTPSVSRPTRKAALTEIAATVAICSDYQLGLAGA
jgi:hypothetical protein